jgi:hypothetical protein
LLVWSINAGLRIASVRGTLSDPAGKLLAHATSSILISRQT